MIPPSCHLACRVVVEVRGGRMRFLLVGFFSLAKLGTVDSFIKHVAGRAMPRLGRILV